MFGLFSRHGRTTGPTEAARAYTYQLEQQIAKLEKERVGVLEGKVDTGSLSAFDRISVLQTLYAGTGPAVDGARTWRRVFRDYPELMAHLALLGGLYALPPRTYENGVPLPEPVDPYELARREGAREVVLKILAHNLSIDELNQLTEASHEL